MKLQIKKEDFQLYAETILSGQIPDEDIPKLLKENPDFDRWYRERLKK